MHNKVTLFRFVNLSGIFLVLTLFIFIPLDPIPPSPSVKSATISRLTLPVLDGAPLASVSAQSLYIYDESSQSTIFEKNGSTKMYPASLTKIMTALVALESYELDQTLTVKSANSSVGSSIHLDAGIEMSVNNLLLAALVSSGNDAAVTLAENYPAGYSSFVDRMNDKARKLHLSDTNYTNVAGMEDELHQTTAKDLTLLTSVAMDNPQFRRLVSTQKITISDVTNTKHYLLENTNLLLGKYGVIGVKTGTSDKAGQNLILYQNRGDHPTIITILNSTDRFKDAQTILDWLDHHLTWQEI